jgi:hypothetical protein
MIMQTKRADELQQGDVLVLQVPGLTDLEFEVYVANEPVEHDEVVQFHDETGYAFEYSTNRMFTVK